MESQTPLQIPHLYFLPSNGEVVATLYHIPAIFKHTYIFTKKSYYVKIVIFLNDIFFLKKIIRVLTRFRSRFFNCDLTLHSVLAEADVLIAIITKQANLQNII